MELQFLSGCSHSDISESVCKSQRKLLLISVATATAASASSSGESEKVRWKTFFLLTQRKRNCEGEVGCMDLARLEDNARARSSSCVRARRFPRRSRPERALLTDRMMQFYIKCFISTCSRVRTGRSRGNILFRKLHSSVGVMIIVKLIAARAGRPPLHHA